MLLVIFNLFLIFFFSYIWYHNHKKNYRLEFFCSMVVAFSSMYVYQTLMPMMIPGYVITHIGPVTDVYYQVWLSTYKYIKSFFKKS